MKRIYNISIACILALGLIFAAIGSSSLGAVFAQTNETTTAATSNSTSMNGNTTGATASIAPINTFSATGDIGSLIFVTQLLSILQAYLMLQNSFFQVIGI
jgi:hypothetical protein